MKPIDVKRDPYTEYRPSCNMLLCKYDMFLIGQKKFLLVIVRINLF